MVGLVVKILITLAVFYGGFSLGKQGLESRSRHSVDCPPANANIRKGAVSAHASSLTTQTEPCTKAEEEEEEEEEEKEDSSSKEECPHKSPFHNQTFLHNWKGDIAGRLFPYLHSPASPTKWAFLLSGSKHWERDAKTEGKEGEGEGEVSLSGI